MRQFDDVAEKAREWLQNERDAYDGASGLSVA
jgi:hypothetical protein